MNGDCLQVWMSMEVENARLVHLEQTNIYSQYKQSPIRENTTDASDGVINLS